MCPGQGEQEERDEKRIGEGDPRGNERQREERSERERERDTLYPGL